MFVSEKGINGKWCLSQDEVSLRQLSCILDSPMHQRYSKSMINNILGDLIHIRLVMVYSVFRQYFNIWDMFKGT